MGCGKSFINDSEPLGLAFYAGRRPRRDLSEDREFGVEREPAPTLQKHRFEVILDEVAFGWRAAGCIDFIENERFFNLKGSSNSR